MIDPDLNVCTYQMAVGEWCGRPAAKWFHSEELKALRGRCSDHLFRYNTLLEVSREEAEVIAVMQS